MLDQYRTLLKESNAISSRTAYVMDDESAVAFRLMPELALLVKKPRNYEWVSQDETYLYRHMKSLEEEQKMMESLHWQQGIRQMQFEKPPVFKLLWADSGNSVALYLNGEPWAFIDEKTHQGYSKAILNPKIGNLWNQELFETIFKIV